MLASWHHSGVGVVGFMSDALDDIVRNSNCPFATETLADGGAKIVEGDYRTLKAEVDNWNDEYEVVVILPKNWTTYYKWCLSMEEVYAIVDLIAIPNSKEGYVLLQRLSDLVDASNSLMKSGFYDDYTMEQIAHVIRRRRLAQEWPRL